MLGSACTMPQLPSVAVLRSYALAEIVTEGKPLSGGQHGFAVLPKPLLLVGFPQHHQHLQCPCRTCLCCTPCVCPSWTQIQHPWDCTPGSEECSKCFPGTWPQECTTPAAALLQILPPDLHHPASLLHPPERRLRCAAGAVPVLVGPLLRDTLTFPAEQA